MAKKESYHEKAGRIGRKLLQGSQAAFQDITIEIERLKKWSGSADELAELADKLKFKALILAEETDIQAHKKLEQKDILEQIIQESATIATLFSPDVQKYVLGTDVEGYFQFSRLIERDARVAAWRRLSDLELKELHEDWQRAVRTKVKD